MKLSKSQRAKLREKFGGCCAYCGCALPERWHADHFEPVIRNRGEDAKTKPAEKSECHAVENMMPACPPCNISKGRQTLEGWRAWLAGHVNSLNSYHPIYRISRAFGLIEETGKPVVFHFERVQQEQPQ